MESRWQDVEDHLRRMFADRLHQHEAGQPLPELTRVEIIGDNPRRGHVMIMVRLLVGGERQYLRKSIPAAYEICDRFWHVFRRQPPTRSSSVSYDARGLWSEMVEDHLIELEIRAARTQLDEIMRVTINPDICRQAYEQYHARVEMIRRTHYRGREPTYDFWSGGPRLQNTRETVEDQARRNALPTRIVDGQQRMAAANEMARMQQLQLTMQTIQTAQQMPNVDYQQLFQRYFESLGGTWSDMMMGTSPEAEKKGLELFKANLTPSQLATYETSNYIEVKGGQSGRTYRIHHGRQMNIRVLDKDGKEVSGLCFLPQGNLVAGDCMLAQKMALELYEEKALKTANHFGPNGQWHRGWTEYALQDTANRMLAAVEADERARTNWQAARNIWRSIFTGS